MSHLAKRQTDKQTAVKAEPPNLRQSSARTTKSVGAAVHIGIAGGRVSSYDVEIMSRSMHCVTIHHDAACSAARSRRPRRCHGDSHLLLTGRRVRPARRIRLAGVSVDPHGGGWGPGISRGIRSPCHRRGCRSRRVVEATINILRSSFTRALHACVLLP